MRGAGELMCTFRWFSTCLYTVGCLSVSAVLSGCGAVDTKFSSNFSLTVQGAGGGGGTVTSNPTGINCGQTCSASFTGGTSVTLTEAPSFGSAFAGWSGGCSGTGSCTVNLAANTSVTATFNTVVPPDTLTVQLAGAGAGTVASSPAGISCGTTCSAGFSSGTMVTLTATANTGSTFAGWSGGCSGTGSCMVTLTANTSVTATFNTVAPPVTLTVQLAGAGAGAVASSPAGISCGTMCSASFPAGTAVALTATANTGSAFGGWTGACTGMGPCNLTLSANTSVSATFNSSSGNISLINHIVFLAQENRSFDDYFGALREYWAQNGYPDQSLDGLPQFNPTKGAAPLAGPPPANPGCDPDAPPPADCEFDTSHPVTSYHLTTLCTENTSPSWNEAHVDWNFGDQVGKYPAKMNAFVWTAGHDARFMVPPFNDTDGVRAMGYYDGTDLNYDYFMASNFATSDRWFHPEMSRTNPNHEYLIAATSQGYAYPNGTNSRDTALLTATTIYEELQNAGISWKIYVNPEGSSCSGPVYAASCLINLSYIKNFTYANTILAKYPQNIATISQYFSDLANGTLPQVAVIEPASEAGLDEHGSDTDAVPTDVQLGARYVSTLINGLMESTSWSDSVFILTYDENGGLFDHVSPQPAVSPDGIPPVDLQPDDVCTKISGPTCNFVFTGYRIPLIVVSPYAKQNYVSHTVADSTAILKFIETRFNLPALTKRDAAQMDMTEFFDFDNPPWMAPPTPPVQATGGPCYLDKLP
jgi:phospholipase C